MSLPHGERTWGSSKGIERIVLTLRIILSDGQYFTQSMLATQLNDLVSDGTLDKNVVVKLTSFVTNAVQGRK